MTTEARRFSDEEQWSLFKELERTYAEKLVFIYFGDSPDFDIQEAEREFGVEISGEFDSVTHGTGSSFGIGLGGKLKYDGAAVDFSSEWRVISFEKGSSEEGFDPGSTDTLILENCGPQTGGVKYAKVLF
jgi:hypothetical protein